MTSKKTSKTLLELAQSGDESAWQDLFDFYTPMVCARIRRDGIVGEDIDQIHADVFSKIYFGLQTFRHNGNVGAFRAYVRTTTRNAVNDFRRSRKERLLPDFEQVPPSEGELSEEKLLLYHRAWEIVRAEFSKRDQQVFEQYIECNRSAADVAKELGLAESNIYRIVSLIKKRIRERFGDELP